MANETEPSIAAPVSSAASASSTLLLSPTTMTATTTAVVSTLTASPMQQESQNSFPPSLFSLGHGTDYESDCNRDHHDRESQVVPIVRILFIIVLVASMACTATAVYQTMTKAETDTFHLSFVSDSNDVIESVGETLYTSLGAVDSYLVSLVSMARSTNQSWPYVSMPDASVRLAKLRSLSKAFSVMQAHFVTLDEKATWENYTTLHQDWAYDAIRIQATDPNYHGKVHDTVIHKPYIRNHLGNATGPGPFLPTWHTSPYVPGTF
jgi:hypothetical protein